MTAVAPLSERLEALLGENVDGLLARYADEVKALHAARLAVARIRAETATFEASFGSRGQAYSDWEHMRKAKLAEIAHNLRLSKPPEGIAKWTEGAIDEAAHRAPSYLDFLEAARADRRRFAELQAKLEEARADVGLKEGILAYLDHRLRIVGSTVYFLGREVQLER